MSEPDNHYTANTDSSVINHYATKQVIVVRRDLHMRKGKAIAQACHGAVNVILQTLDRDALPWYVFDSKSGEKHIAIDGESALADWFSDSYAKICLYVDSEQELLDLKKKCDEQNILSCLVQDNGTTEFHGVKTYTCLVLEPLDSRYVDAITGRLPLY